MKTIFSFVFAAAAALGATVALSPSVRAEAVYFTRRSVLTEFFPKSERVTYQTFTPDAKQRTELRKRLGYELPRKSYTFYVALSGNTIDGYALIDDERGQHEPITFAIKLSPDGVVERHEVMVYRESWGDEIRDARFRKQFEGKTVTDRIACGSDIAAVSGATISSNSMAVGVRRALILFDAARTRLEGRFSSHVSTARAR